MPTSKKKLTTCEPKTAVAYARYSSANQRDVSIDQQLQDIRAYADREGYTIIHEYADRAKSGYTHVDRRAEFQAMLRAASSGAFDTVLAWKVDRFGRNRRESAMYKGQLADQGVSVVYAMEPIPDGAAGVLTEGMLEAIAEWYSKNLSENVKRGLYDNARKCNANGNKVFGYDIDQEGHYIVNEAEAAIVRRIFTLYSEGNSFHTIEKALAAEGVKTPRGANYSKATLTYMLANVSYDGIYHYCNVRIPGGMPAIINHDLFEYCQDLRRRTKRHLEKSQVTYYLSGKCHCGWCNATMIGNYSQPSGKSSRRHYYYTCTNRKRFSTCNMPNAKKDELETKVFDFLFSKLLKDTLLELFANSIINALDEFQEESVVPAMEKELNSINKKIKNINLAIADGIWTKATGDLLNELTDRAELLKKEISNKKLTENRKISRDMIRFYLQKIAEGKRDDPEYLFAIATTFINSVSFYKDYARIVVNAAENVPKIPPDELPPLDNLPDGNLCDFRPTHASALVTVAPYPVIVFKIAI